MSSSHRLCWIRPKLSDRAVCECRRKRTWSDSSCAAFVVGFGVSSLVSTWSPHVDISVILPRFFLPLRFFLSFVSSLLCLSLFAFFFFVSSGSVSHICLCYCQCGGLSFGPLYRPINGRACLGLSGSDWLGVTNQSVFSLVTSAWRTHSSLPCCCRAGACPTAWSLRKVLDTQPQTAAVSLILSSSHRGRQNNLSRHFPKVKSFISNSLCVLYVCVSHHMSFPAFHQKMWIQTFRIKPRAEYIHSLIAC